MLGKIALEEAYEEPDKVQAQADSLGSAACAPDDRERWSRQMSSITGERLDLSKKHGIGYTILSVTGPGCQMIYDPGESAREARRLNDHLHEKIKDHREDFGAFANLSMHNAADASQELRRAVTELGFHGALVYNYQHAGSDASTWLWYDEPEYDAFWGTCVEPDVPVYIHPSLPVGVKDETWEHVYGGCKYLVGPTFSFATGVSLHILRMIISGVFDRFPKLKIIIGHLGERMPIDLWRMNAWIQRRSRPWSKVNGDVFCKQDDITYYFKNNIWLTTSGNFHTPALKYVCDNIGADRVLFSVDYPYEKIEDGCGWYDGEAQQIIQAIGEKAYKDIGRENAKAMFKLPAYYQSES